MATLDDILNGKRQFTMVPTATAPVDTDLKGSPQYMQPDVPVSTETRRAAEQAAERLWRPNILNHESKREEPSGFKAESADPRAERGVGGEAQVGDLRSKDEEAPNANTDPAPLMDTSILNGTQGEEEGTEDTGGTTAKEDKSGDEKSRERRVQRGKRLSYVELYKEMNPYKMPTKEEVEAEKRKQRRNQLFAAISDGISAMSSLYFTTQYAPNTWDHTNNMSAKTRARWERAQKEREENERTYMNGYLQALARDEAAEQESIRQRLAQEQAAAKAKQEERALQLQEQAAAAKQKLADLQQQKINGEIAEQQFKTDAQKYIMQIKKAEAESAKLYYANRANGNTGGGTGKSGKRKRGRGGGDNKNWDKVQTVKTEKKGNTTTKTTTTTYRPKQGGGNKNWSNTAKLTGKG